MTGIATYLLWLIVRWDWLMLAGAITIWIGISCVVAGFVCLGVYMARGRESQPVTGVATVGAILILLADFPIAAAIVFAASYVHGLYKVTIINNGESDLHDVIVLGTSARFGSIRTGEQRTRRFHPQWEGALEFQALKGGQMISGTIDGYASPGIGASLIVTFAPDGTWEVRRDGIPLAVESRPD